MSRIANNPVDLPAGVEARLDGARLTVTGAKGSLQFDINPAVEVRQDGARLEFLARSGGKSARALAGTTRSLVGNMVTGVSAGFQKRLTLQGVGYRARAADGKLNLQLGYSHPVQYELPAGVEAATPSPTEILITGADKQAVGQAAAEIRAFRPPEPYKGKGVRYADERVRRKEAKKK